MEVLTVSSRLGTITTGCRLVARGRFVATYVAFWGLYFQLLRAAFLLYEWRNTVHLTNTEIAGSFVFGLKHDLSAAAVLTMLPLCLAARAGFVATRAVVRIIVAYTAFCIIAVAMTTAADLELFRVWGHHLDAPALRYLASPNEAIASAGASPVLLLLVSAVGAAMIMFTLFTTCVVPIVEKFSPVKHTQSVLLMCLALPQLVVAERGGIDRRVHITTSSVYFTNTVFADQAAVNASWNLVASAFDLDREGAVYAIDNDERARVIVDSLLSSRGVGGDGKDKVDKRIIRQRPRRVIVLLWEGLTAKIVEPLGGLKGVTPGITKLAREGVLFSEIYAAGQRTTNGLVAVLSGLPTHPLANPLESSLRSAALPRLSSAMSAAGYRTLFYYGSTLEFDNRERYVVRSRFDSVVQKADFDPQLRTSPWGVHDGVMLDALFSTIDTVTAPLFVTALTLSSHEPFTVPPPVLIPGDGVEEKFLNAQAYSDQAVTHFVAKLKRGKDWGRTLVIVVADHGSPYPLAGSAASAATDQFRIPMLWLGGALAVKDLVIPRIGAQFDIPTTVLAALDIPSKSFPFGKNLLSSRTNQFAFYAFQDGFGYADQHGSFVFDNPTRSVVERKGLVGPSSIHAGRAFQQEVMQAYHDLSQPLKR